MGLTHIATTISKPTKSRPPYEAGFLVDTDAFDCLGLASDLKAAGIEIKGGEVYELANGNAVEYSHGFAEINFMERKRLRRSFSNQKIASQ